MNTFFARNGWRVATCTLMVSAALAAPLAHPLTHIVLQQLTSEAHPLNAHSNVT